MDTEKTINNLKERIEFEKNRIISLKNEEPIDEEEKQIIKSEIDECNHHIDCYQETINILQENK